MTTALTKFNGRPETYRTCQLLFINVISGLGVYGSKVLNLLLKWLSKESTEQIRRIHAVHINNPPAAPQMAWNRLNEWIGAIERAIEQALLNLDSFFKITAQDNVKLRELEDILLELNAAKADIY